MRIQILPLCIASLVGLAPGIPAQRESAEPQRTRLDLTPLQAKTDQGRSAELVPVLDGRVVLVSTSLRLHALDAASGALLWSSPPPEGWEQLLPGLKPDLWLGLDREALLVAPASGSGVAVAALQLPRARRTADDWQGIPVSVPMPERRLHAFELASGRPLWSHAAPGDLSASSFPQRMNVCGAPLVAGMRVLVPCSADESSIDYHVAAYDLATGALLWSTFVQRGQTPRGSFGYASVEFVAAPLAVSPDASRVLAATGLGRVAALALGTGEILWSIDYEAIPLPKVRSYGPPPRRTTWRTSPPVLDGDLLWVTPRDGTELIAFDLATGVRRASVSARELQALVQPEAKLELDHLIGVRGELVWLGGTGAAAFRREGGLAGPGPWRLAWYEPGERASVRGRLEGEALLLPGASGLRVLAPLSGTELAREPGPRLFGLAATDTSLFLLSADGLELRAR
ncbi:MAG TPA: PQQ-binding-like beta-propeller repeat protein [Planctomycetota bacterium]